MRYINLRLLTYLLRVLYTQLYRTVASWWHSSLVAISGVICCLRETDDELFMTGSFNVTPKTTEQHLIVCIGKSEAHVTSNKRLRSMYVLLKLTTGRYEASHGFSATAELLLLLPVWSHTHRLWWPGLPSRWTQTLEQPAGFTASVQHDSRPVQETAEDSLV